MNLFNITVRCILETEVTNHRRFENIKIGRVEFLNGNP